MTFRAAPAAFALAAALAAGRAGAIELTVPYICPEGVTCLVQSLVDRDPGPDATDFTCGPMTYDGHKGVDFRVASFADLKRGVEVLAAAPGVIKATRDGERDAGVAGMTEGRDCGNGVVIDHADGWSTQYCHLARGSVAVVQGDEVAAGQRIGFMGFSGRTEFPHLHMTLRKDDVVIDPFDGGAADEGCGGAEAGGLWAEAPELRLGGVIDQGFIGERPTLERVRAGLPERLFDPDDGALIFWARSFGQREGDELEIALIGPDGEALARSSETLDRAQAIVFRFVGKRRPEAGWPAGRYEGHVAIRRDGRLLEERRIALDLE